MRILFVFVFLSSVAFGQTEKKQFIELNGGIASIGTYNYSMPMPGGSVLYGQTIQKNNLVLEWQAGAAFPSIVTGKLGIGTGTLNSNLMLSIRPWPLTLGPQLKIRNLSMSFEVGIPDGSPDLMPSMGAGFIFTIGWRWQVKSKKDKIEELDKKN